MEEDENGVVGCYRIHIVDLNNVARPVEDILLDAIIIDCHVDEVDAGVSRGCDADGRADTFCVKLAKPELEDQYRNAHLKDVREEIEAENRVENLRLCNSLIQNERDSRAERPEKREIRDDLASREYRKGEYQRVERAEMEWQIFKRRAPGYKIIDDRGDSREGKNAENDYLDLFAASLKGKVESDVEEKGDNKTEYVSDAEGSPSHDRIVSFCHFNKKVKTYNMIP